MMHPKQRLRSPDILDREAQESPGNCSHPMTTTTASSMNERILYSTKESDQKPFANFDPTKESPYKASLLQHYRNYNSKMFEPQSSSNKPPINHKLEYKIAMMCDPTVINRISDDQQCSRKNLSFQSPSMSQMSPHDSQHSADVMRMHALKSKQISDQQIWTDLKSFDKSYTEPSVPTRPDSTQESISTSGLLEGFRKQDLRIHQKDFGKERQKDIQQAMIPTRPSDSLSSYKGYSITSSIPPLPPSKHYQQSTNDTAYYNTKPCPENNALKLGNDSSMQYLPSFPRESKHQEIGHSLSDPLATQIRNPSAQEFFAADETSIPETKDNKVDSDEKLPTSKLKQTEHSSRLVSSIHSSGDTLSIPKRENRNHNRLPLDTFQRELSSHSFENHRRFYTHSENVEPMNLSQYALPTRDSCSPGQPALQSEQHLGRQTITTRSKLIDLQAKIASFEANMQAGAQKQQRKAFEEQRIASLAENISNLEKTIHAEISRRTEATASIEQAFESQLVILEKQINNSFRESENHLMNIVSTMSDRLSTAEEHAIHLQRSHNENTQKIKGEIEATSQAIEGFKEHFDHEFKLRRQREAALCDKISDLEKQIEGRLAMNHEHNISEIDQLRSSMNAINHNHIALDEAFQKDLTGAFQELKTALESERLARERSDDDIVQALNQYTIALQAALKLANSD